MTALAALAWVAFCLVASFVAWDLNNLFDGATWLAARIIIAFGAMLTFFYVTDSGKSGGKKEWHQATADKHAD